MGIAMTVSFHQVASEAMKLSAEERMNLAEKLWISVETPAEVEAAWDAEIERRVQQLDAGEVDTVSMDVVIAELRAKLQ